MYKMPTNCIILHSVDIFSWCKLMGFVLAHDFGSLALKIIRLPSALKYLEMLHNTNRTKCLIPYRLENADAITEKVFRNFFAVPCDFCVVFLSSALGRFLCRFASLLNICASILTFICFIFFFFFTCVLSEGLCVPIRLVRNDPKAPSEECYVVWRSPHRCMCFALFCAAFGHSVPVFTLTWSVSLVLKPLSNAFDAQH